jgi:hypothetical protein
MRFSGWRTRSSNGLRILRTGSNGQKWPFGPGSNGDSNAPSNGIRTASNGLSSHTPHTPLSVRRGSNPRRRAAAGFKPLQPFNMPHAAEAPRLAARFTPGRNRPAWLIGAVMPGDVTTNGRGIFPSV